jgi:hypothetical protein
LRYLFATARYKTIKGTDPKVKIGVPSLPLFISSTPIFQLDNKKWLPGQKVG